MQAQATLKKCFVSPRKTRIVIDTIRGLEVTKALNVLKNNSKQVSIYIQKLLLSSISNWYNKNDENYQGEIYIKEIWVNSAGMLKRIKPAPQGRAHRIRKKFNHITIVVSSKEVASEKENSKSLQIKSTISKNNVKEKTKDISSKDLNKKKTINSISNKTKDQLKEHSLNDKNIHKAEIHDKTNFTKINKGIKKKLQSEKDVIDNKNTDNHNKK